MNNMNQRPRNCGSGCNTMPSGCMCDKRNKNNMANCKKPMPAMEKPCKPCNPCRCTDCSSAENDPLRGLAVGIGYVPWQQWDCIYNVDEGLSRGTIFPSLDLPFYGCIPRGYSCNKGCNCEGKH